MASKHPLLLSTSFVASFFWDYALHKVVLTDLCRYPYTLLFLQAALLAACIEVRRRYSDLPPLSLERLREFFLPSVLFGIALLFSVTPYYNIYSNTFLFLRSFLPLCTYAYGIYNLQWPFSTVLLSSYVLTVLALLLTVRQPLNLTVLSVGQALIALVSFVASLIMLTQRKQQLSTPLLVCCQAFAVNIMLVMFFHSFFINGELLAAVLTFPRELITGAFIGHSILMLASGCLWLFSVVFLCYHSSLMTTVLSYVSGCHAVISCLFVLSVPLVTYSCLFYVALISSSIALHCYGLQQISPPNSLSAV